MEQPYATPPPSAPAPPPARTSTSAIVSLIFGILAWTMLPFIGALVAIICGHIARGEIRHSQGRVEGAGLALAGLLMGWVQLLLTALAVFAVVALIGGIFSWGGFWSWVQSLEPHNNGCLST